MPGRQLRCVENTGPHYHLQDHSILDKLIKMSTRGCGLYGRWSDDEDEWRQDRGVEELVQPWWWAGSPNMGPPCRAAGSCSCRAGQALGPSHFPANPISPSKEAGTALLASLIFFPREKPAEGPISEPQLVLGPLPPGLSSHSGDHLASGPGPHGALPFYTLIISQISCFCVSLLEPWGSTGQQWGGWQLPRQPVPPTVYSTDSPFGIKKKNISW